MCPQFVIGDPRDDFRDRLGQGHSKLLLAELHIALGRYVEARLLATEALSDFEELGNEPGVLDALIQRHIDDIRDADTWNEKLGIQNRHRAELKGVAEAWETAVEAVADTVEQQEAEEDEGDDDE